MQHYLSIHDIPDLETALQEMAILKQHPLITNHIGKGKTLGLLFFNSSLRTRLSTEKAARNLGMEVLILNVDRDSWQLEFEDGVVMDATKAEHIKEAAAVLSQYCDLLAIRAFPRLQDKAEDEAEQVLSAFAKYATVPIINMESSTAHPLQGLTDAFTITELAKTKIAQGKKLNVVLSWAPHPKALPHAVAHSFVKTMQRMDVHFKITHPQGYELNKQIVGNTPVVYDQKAAVVEADIIYVKNWSSYTEYGKVVSQDTSWQVDEALLQAAPQAKVMHCLPVRRNVVIVDAVLDSPASAVIQQAGNRTYAAQYVLQKLLTHGN